MTQFRLGRLGGLRPEQRCGGIAWRKLDKQENDDRHAEDHWNNAEQARKNLPPSVANESGHSAQRLLD